MRLAERDQQLGELYDLLDRAARGRGGCALVTASGGCGRTAVLGAVAERAAEAGFRVLTAAIAWEDRSLPGHALGHLLRGPGAPVLPEEDVAELLRSLGGAEPPAAPGRHRQRDEPDPETADHLHRVTTAILAAAAERPTLICIDNVHYLDPPSWQWLLLFLRAVPGSRVALVMSQCDLLPAHSPLRAELLRQPDYRRIQLPALSRDGVEAMLGEHLDRMTARRLAGQFHAVSLGVPLLVRALLEDVRSSAEPVTDVVLGSAFVDVALSIMERYDPGLLHTAQALALLDEDDLHPETVARLLGEQTHIVDYYMRGLTAHGFLDGRRLRHAAVREAVLRTIPPRRAQQLHAEVAGILYANGAPPIAVARHLVAADRGSAPWAVGVLRSAAEQLAADHRLADAHGCLELALRVCADEPVRAELKLDLARTAWLLNPALCRHHTADLAHMLRDGRLPARHALMIARYLLWFGQSEEAVDALALAGQDTGDDTAAAMDEYLSRELMFVTFPALRAHEKLRAGQDRRTPRAPGGDPRVRVTAALVQVLGEGPDGTAVADADAAMWSMRLDQRSYVPLRAGVAALLYADRLDDAGRWCDHWLEQARAQKVPMWEGHFAALRAEISLRQGDLDRAAALARTALARVPLEGWGTVAAAPLSVLVHAATETGDHTAAAAHLKVPLPQAVFQSRFGMFYLYARGRHHAETGQPHAALNDFTSCGTTMTAWGFDPPSVVPWRIGAAYAHLALGHTEKAAALAHRQAMLVRDDRPRTRGMTLRVLAATAAPADRVGLLTQAVDSLRACGDKLHLARALGDLGREHRAAGHPARAQAVLRLAAGLAAECG
ncbi:AAA family ATPase, partial [Streptomyces capparidis]